MALPTRRNLGDLRQELRERLGFGAQGAEAGPSIRIMNSFLRNAQEQLIREFDFNDLIVETSLATGVGQTLYTWPDNCDPDNVISVVLEDTVDTIANRYKLIEGINYQHDAHSVPNDQPRRFERRTQLEIWPPPDRTTYNIILEYVKRPDRFQLDQDKASINEDLLLLHALTNGKAHYQHADAQIYANQLQRMLGKLRSKNNGSERINRQGHRRREFVDDFDAIRHLNVLDL